ncbi:ExbD/TolR family protein [Anaeroarcus burkinensis]|uniref:ExbD/TolR family protein n=1 Tax=Anaeroarcus burkinensis TaxID=82376 RepID=UPI0003FC8666|nr:biopolymer transporter ExbD [Anaeroarcus burkinensis]
MKLPRNMPKKARLEIIPMIDTMFFLLVFFMLASLTMTNQQALPVQPPQAQGVATNASQRITLTLTRGNNLFYNQEPIASPQEALQRLQSQSPPPAVLLNADRSVSHGQVVELLDSLRRKGISKIAVAVTEER